MFKKCSSSETNLVLPCKGEGKESASVTLKRNLTLLNACTLIVGSIVGSGIFVSPKGVLLGAGSVGLSMIIWSVSGIIAILGGLCYVELGTTFPQSGCDYTYLQICLGDFPAFLYLWMKMAICHPAGIVIGSLTFANYVLKSFFPNCPIPQDATRFVAATVICLLTYINCHKVQWVTRAQDFFTFAKVIALLNIIIIGIYQLFTDQCPSLKNSFEGTNSDPGSIALSFYSGMYAYASWNVVNNVTEEIKDPSRNLPRSICMSVPFVIFLYVLTNIAYFSVLSPEEILSSSAVAVTFGDRKLGMMSWIMPLSVAMSTFGHVNGSIFSKSRILLAGSRQGHLPELFSMINIHYSTPVPCLVFQCILSLFYLTTTEVYELINNVMFMGTMFDTLTIAGMLWMRYKQPDLERPIKMNFLIPVAYLLTNILLMIIPIYIRPVKAACGVGLALLGIPIYFLTIFWVDKPKVFNEVMTKITKAMQKLFLSMPEENAIEGDKGKTETPRPAAESFKTLTEDLQYLKQNITYITKL